MFKNIDQIKTVKEKKFFVEKTKIFINLVNLSLKKLKIKTRKLNDEINFLTNIRLLELGIFTNEKNSHEALKKLLPLDLYKKFIVSININNLHKDEINP